MTNATTTTPTEVHHTITECSASNNTTAPAADNKASLDDHNDPMQPRKKISTDNTITLQLKLSSDNNFVKNRLVTDVPFPRSSSFQERKILFIEQARRLVTNI